MSIGKFQGITVPDHTDWLAPRVTEKLAANGNCPTVDFVGVAGVIPQHVEHEWQIDVAGSRIGLRLSRRLKRRQIVDFSSIKSASL